MEFRGPKALVNLHGCRQPLPWDYFPLARYPGLIPVGSQKLSSHYEFLATTIRITAD